MKLSLLLLLLCLISVCYSKMLLVKFISNTHIVPLLTCLNRTVNLISKCPIHPSRITSSKLLKEYLKVPTVHLKVYLKWLRLQLEEFCISYLSYL